MTVTTKNLNDAEWQAEREQIAQRFLGIGAEEFVLKFKAGAFENEDSDGLMAVRVAEPRWSTAFCRAILIVRQAQAASLRPVRRSGRGRLLVLQRSRPRLGRELADCWSPLASRREAR